MIDELFLINRSSPFLIFPLSFLARYVSHPRYARLIIQVAHRVVDLYAEVLGRSDSIDELFVKLHRQVKAEVGFQKQAVRVVGSLDGIISAASLASVSVASRFEEPVHGGSQFTYYNDDTDVSLLDAMDQS